MPIVDWCNLDAEWWDKRKFTIELEEATAERVRVLAAQRDTGDSRFISEPLTHQKRASRCYDSAWQWFRERELRPLSQPGKIYPDREDLHGRPAGR